MSENQQKKILLAHGGGGRLMNSLIEKHIRPRLGDDRSSGMTDSAFLDLPSSRISFTTDSFVVQPLFFNGGDIGKLAVCGTVNDLAVSGAKPLAISLSLIIEEGLAISDLDRILESIKETADQAGVSVVTGDTKVVEAGAADGIFINTTGIGIRIRREDPSFERIAPGDKLIINGTIGDHGMTIVSRRKGIRFDSPLKSDCAALSKLITAIMESGAGGGVKFMRDPTRGGLAATTNEIAAAAGLDIELTEDTIPINPTVQAAADMLGFDLLNIANEGKAVIIADPQAVEQILEICKADPLGKDAAVIGEVLETTDPGSAPIVELVTRIGGRRIVQMPYGRELPRIC